jgi:hypothetical protein
VRFEAVLPPDIDDPALVAELAREEAAGGWGHGHGPAAVAAASDGIVASVKSADIEAGNGNSRKP